MKMTYVKIFIVLFVLIFSNFSYALKHETQLQEANKTSKAFFKAEVYKAVEKKLIIALKAERNSKLITESMKKIWKTAKNLNKSQMKTFLARFSNASKTSIKKLANMSPKQLGGYIKGVVSKVKLNIGSLKQIISGAGDKACKSAMKAISLIDDAIAKTGTVSKTLLKRIRDGVSKLNPKQAKAYLDLVKKRFLNEWKSISDLKPGSKGPGSIIGTVVDGIFVFNDAVNIYYSDDEPEEKAIKATAKIVEYGFSTGAGAASTALGGGLGPGLVIALSANRVATLYTEIMMLQRERKLAKDAEKEVKLNNGILARRQFINISQKIKSGQLKNAKFLLSKMMRFLINNKFQNEKMLFKIQSNLEQKFKNAERADTINKILNKARFPYKKAMRLYLDNHNLTYAKELVLKAFKILNSKLNTYPELKTLKAIPNINKLIAAINSKIENATDIYIISISGPKRVKVGEFEHYTMKVKGGIPDYEPIGIDGYGTRTSVTVYWEAPKKPGKEKVSFTVKDDLGKVTTATVSIIVENEGEEIEETNKEDYSNLKVFVYINSKGVPVEFYSAIYSHKGYSNEFEKKLMYKDKEKDEGFWVRVSCPEGGKKERGVSWYCLPHGPYRSYESDGKTLKITGVYGRGKKHGKFTYYLTEGSRKGQVDYLINYKNDMKHGITTFYSEGGKPSVVNNYKNDKKHGTQITYSKNVPGGVSSKQEFRNGKNISGFTWSEYRINGKLVSWIKRIYEENGNSIEERYGKDFNILSKTSTTYKSGKSLTNSIKYKKGMIIKVENWFDGELHGIQKEFFSNGGSVVENWKYGKKNGTFITKSNRVPGGVERKFEYKDDIFLGGFYWKEVKVNNKTAAWDRIVVSKDNSIIKHDRQKTNWGRKVWPDKKK